VKVVATLGILVCAAMIFGLGWTNWARLFGWLIIGFIIYFGYSRHHSRLRNPEKYPPESLEPPHQVPEEVPPLI
jgi:APA family basic amino acid/polyamine antiporter